MVPNRENAVGPTGFLISARPGVACKATTFLCFIKRGQSIILIKVLSQQYDGCHAKYGYKTRAGAT